MDGIDILMEDHRLVEHLFKQLEDTNSSEKASLFLQLFQELSLHAVVEEQVVYPELSLLGMTGDKVKEAFREHADMKATLGEMAAMEAKTAEWKTRLAELKKEVQHHVKEEEGEIFTFMRQKMSQKDLMAMTYKIQECKQGAIISPLMHLPLQKIQQHLGKTKVGAKSSK